MQSKSLLIAIAAFAVTTTGVHAYGGTKILNRAGLSDDQVTAIEEARDLRASGEFDAARDKLVEAGVTEDTLKSIHKAAQGAKDAMREALKEGDYEKFLETVEDSPLADIITSKYDFEQFRLAHQLKMSGEREESQVIFDELGLDSKGGHEHKMGLKKGFGHELTEEQKEALMVARQANDKATMQAIFDEAGEEFSHHRGW